MYKISLAQWSLHRTLLGVGPDGVDWERLERDLRSDPNHAIRGEMDHLDFITAARRDYDIGAVEYVNTFFFGRAQDKAYLKEMKDRADGEGVKSLLIMCDFEGRPGDLDRRSAQQAVENHYKWVEAAQFLGCHAIRVNIGNGMADPDGQAKWAAEDLRSLAEFSAPYGIRILVENHGEWSSNAAWLAGVVRSADHPGIGTLPDFGNFRISDSEWYDYYQGVEELMPYAGGVSAKSYDFDEKGRETTLDYERLISIIIDAGYTGYIDVEYEGERLSEPDGIRATKALLDRLKPVP